MNTKYFLGFALACLWGGVVAPWPASAGMDIKETEDLISIAADGEPILEYRQTCNPNKVYVSKLYTPSGLQILLDSPDDHVHHHGLMYALDAGKTSWWVDGATMGKQVPSGETVTRAHKDSAAINQSLDWNNGSGETILKEERTITAHTGEGLPATLVTWNTVLGAAGKEPVLLETDKHYAGLGIRFVRKMDQSGTFLFPDGSNATAVRGTEKVTPDKWCAYVTRVDEQPVTVAMFSVPSNVRHPTYWFTMTGYFAYISATLNLYREPYSLQPGSPLDLTYGIAVFDGKQDGATIEDLYQHWLKLEL